MRNIRGLLSIAVATLALAQATSASDTGKIAGVGTQSCRSWTSYVRSPINFEATYKNNATSEAAYTSWAQGYASGAAIWNGPEVFRVMTSAEFIDTISDRCKAYPSARIDTVVKKIIVEAPPPP